MDITPKPRRSLLPRHGPFARGRFGFQLLTLMSGTIPAQFAMVLSAPVLTRLYDPIDFAMYAIFAVGVNLITSIAPGRYEFALVLPDDETEAINLFTLAMGLSFLVAVGTFGLAVAFRPWFKSWFDLASDGYWIWLVAPGVWANSWFNVIAKWQSRKERFRNMAQAQVGGTVATLGIQIAMGVLASAPTGISLMCGYLLGRFIATLMMCWNARADLIHLRPNIALQAIRTGARRYWHFPAFSGVGILVGRAAHEVPKLMLAAWFTPQLLGYFSLGVRVLATPAELIGRAVADVLFPRISRCRYDSNRSRTLLKKVCLHMSLVVLPPMLILLLWADWIFTIIFGTEWAPAGHYAKLMIPMVASQFIVTPIRNAMQAFEKQHIVLVWHIVFLVLSVVAFAAGQRVGSADVAILNYSLMSMAMYAAYVGMCFYFAQGCEKDIEDNTLAITSVSAERGVRALP